MSGKPGRKRRSNRTQTKLPANGRQFEWPDGNPTNEDDFMRLMWAIDRHLTDNGLQPLHRVCGFNIEGLLRDSGLDWGNRYAWISRSVNEPGYTGEPLVAKAYQWFEEVYGEKVLGKSAEAEMWSVGFFPVKLGNGAVWKVRIPRTLGWPTFVFDLEDFEASGKSNFVSWGATRVNVLRLIEEFPLKLVEYVPLAERDNLTELCATALGAVDWLRVAAKRDTLFGHARQDYVSSTANLLSYNYSQSRWSSAQAVEKILKGLFKVVVGEDAQKTHDLMVLAKQLEPSLTQSIDAALLSAATWPTSARYDETKTTLEECLCANHAVLRLAEQFSKDDKVVELFDGARAK